MKVTFEFHTDDENFNQDELNRFYDADNMAMCLEALREKVRSWIKWDQREEIPKEEIEKVFWEIIQDHNISFEKLGY